MTVEQQKEAVTRLMVEGFGEGQLEVFEELCHPEVVLTVPESVCVGRPALLVHAQRVFRAFELRSMRVKYVLADENATVMRLTFRAVQTRTYYDIEPHGGRISLEELIEFRYADGLIRDIRVYYDPAVFASEMMSDRSMR